MTKPTGNSPAAVAAWNAGARTSQRARAFAAQWHADHRTEDPTEEAIAAAGYTMNGRPAPADLYPMICAWIRAWPKYAAALATDDPRRIESAERSIRAMARQPAWLQVRNNDPHGTTGRHPFWATVTVECIAHWKIFERGGTWYGYDTRHNAWATFTADRNDAVTHAKQARADPWT